MKQAVFLFTILFASGISFAQADLSSSDKWMFYYYQHPQPERLVENVRVMSKRGQLADAQTAGVIPAFLSRVFTQNPQKIDQWMTALRDLPENECYTLYNAVWLSDTNEGRTYLKKVGLEIPGNAVPDLLSIEIKEPVLIDALWGHFMATGDTRVVRRIISGFNYSRYEGAKERYKTSKKTEQDRQEANYAVIFQAARASLIDNCKMHPVVLTTCERLSKGKELNQTESLWLSVILAKVAPEKYKLEIRK